MSTCSLALSDLTIDLSVQPREKPLDDGHADEIAAVVKGGQEMPPVRVFRLPNGEHLLTRGFHRCEGYKRAGKSHIPAEIHEGDRKAAELDATASAGEHNVLQFKGEDKHNAAVKTIRLEPTWTDEKVASHCGFTTRYVNDIRAQLAAVQSTKKPANSPSEFGTTSKFDSPTEKGNKKRGRKPHKVNHAAAAGPLIKANPSRSDEDIAKEVGCNPNVVALARKALIKDGQIPAPPKKRPKPKTPDSSCAVQSHDQGGEKTTPQNAKEPADQPGGTSDSPAKKKSSKKEPAPVIRDGLGNVVPDCVADTFGDPTLKEAISRIDAVHAELLSIEKNIVQVLSPKAKFWPFAFPGDAAISLKNAINAVAIASGQLAVGLPFCVCQKCKGEGCVDCRDGGTWNRHRYEQRAQYGDRP